MMKLFKNLIVLGLFLIAVGLFIERRETIMTYLSHVYREFNEESLDEKKNIYYRDYDFTFVKNTNDFHPQNFQDIINIYYTIINSGVDTYTFKCDREYQTCLQDIDNLAASQTLLSDINNYVHPFNSFTNIETSYDNMGYVTVNIIKTYTKEQIDSITKIVEDLYTKLYNPNLSKEENIKIIHDYIVNNTKYDLTKKNGKSQYQSDNAYGALLEGYAVCGGYSDTMALFLEKLKIKNFKISSDKHVWNALLLNDRWLHLDLTWDDPVTSDGSNCLEHNYFLVNTEQLFSLEQEEHFFNESSYPEFVIQKSN